MTSQEVIERIRGVPNRKALSRETGLPYDYLCRLVKGRIKDPGSQKIDVLRDYFQKAERQ